VARAKDLTRGVENLTAFDEPTLFRMMPQMREILRNILQDNTFNAIAGSMGSEANIIRVCGLPFDLPLMKIP